MQGSWPVMLALLLAPATADPASTPDPKPSCEVWIYGDEHWPKLEPTDACPSWTVYIWHVEPADESEILTISRFSSNRHRHNALLTRDSFFEVMTHQAAGMLATPIAPRPSAAPRARS